MGRLRAVTTKIWPKHFCEDVIENAPALFQRNDFWACTCTHAIYLSLIPSPVSVYGTEGIKRETLELRQSERSQ